jgi:DNA (cytosine-5)-methyltransferase 1
MFSFLGLAEKLGKPRWIVWENVPGCLSSGEPKGSDFGCLIQGLVELGYGVSWRILDAQHFGVPQRRRRVFVVACLGDWRAAAEVLSLREGLRGYLETGNKKRKGVAADAGASPTAGCWWDGGQVSQPHIVQASELRLRGQITEKSVCPTLTAGAKQGDTDPLAVHAVTFQPGNLRREAGADPSFTTTTTLKASAGDQTPHVAYAQGVDLYNQTLTGDLHVPLRTAGGHGAPACMTPMAVRRLTPVECERLQGFPDNWSRISWKGKPEEQCPDGPRYKACGNSMAVPCMFWIGSRIAAYELSQNHETK